MPSDKNDFSAQEPSLGYYYQLRFGLDLLLKCKNKTNPIIKIETLDDIVVEDINSTDLYQTKLHIHSIANLTDASPDFWKTIRVWSENIRNDMVDIETTLFTLITTAKIGDDSYINDFSTLNDQREVRATRDKMLEIIQSSKSATNAKAYEAFARLTEDQQIKLLTNIFVVDAAMQVHEVLDSIKSELRFCATPNKLDALVERVEGWWFGKCIQHLRQEIEGISFQELHSKIADIQDAFKTDNLPDDFADPLSVNVEDMENYDHRIFIKQLRIIAIKSHTLRQAISDFKRAFEQRSKWLREELINPQEEELYETRLYDNWQAVFNSMRDDCEELKPEDLESIGKDFYKKFYLERTPPIKIRERFSSEYLTRGSCHILSDKKKIGWHPKFKDLLL